MTARLDLDVDVMREIRRIVVRLDQAALERVVALVGVGRVELSTRIAVAAGLRKRGRREIAHAVEVTKAPRGCVLVVHAPHGEPELAAASVWPGAR